MAEPTANEKILDRTIRHSVYLERLKIAQARRLLASFRGETLDEVIDFVDRRIDRIRSRDIVALRTKAYAEMMTKLSEIVSGGVDTLAGTLGADLDDIAIAEGEWQVALLRKATPVSLDFTSPSPATLRAVSRARPLQGRFLKDIVKDLETSVRRRITSAVNLGLVQGEATRQIVSRVRLTNDFALREAEAIARTAVQHTVSYARQEVYASNASLIQSIRWVSTLDSRTTQICLALDGKEYDVDKGPRPPAHIGCRSTTVPVLKSWRALGLKDPPPSTRASLGGQVPVTLTYGEWLRRQPIDVQEHVLGPGKAALFRRGIVPVERFIDTKLRPLTLAELKELESDLLGAA